MKISYGNLVTYIDGCRAIVRINYSLVTPVKSQVQSDGISLVYDRKVSLHLLKVPSISSALIPEPCC